MSDQLDKKDLVEALDRDPSIPEIIVDTEERDSSQCLVDYANNTFRELCKTLEDEQNKLIELETRRMHLHAEMERLKMEIEEEKQSYRLNLVESVSDNLDVLNGGTLITNGTGEPIEMDIESLDDFIARNEVTFTSHQLETCYEVDEEDSDEHEITIHEETSNITPQVETDVKDSKEENKMVNY